MLRLSHSGTATAGPTASTLTFIWQTGQVSWRKAVTVCGSTGSWVIHAQAVLPIRFDLRLSPLIGPLLPQSLMELSIAHAVYGLAVGITNFIAEHDDKDAVHQQISIIVTQIQNIIHPLKSRKLINLPLEQCLQGLQSVLSSIDEHMKAWKESRSRRILALFNPWAVTQQLKDDREQLMAHYILLMGAIQIVDHIKGYNLITPPPKVDHSPSQEEKRMVKGKGSEVLDFWEKCIGEEVSRAKFFFVWSSIYIAFFQKSGSVKGAYFCKQLSLWMGTRLDRVACQRLLLRLDYNNTGYVTLATLQDLVQNGNMRETINSYSAGINRYFYISLIVTLLNFWNSDPTLPLLIWIDDDILGNAPQALAARKAGITVVQIGSTSAAKTWILTNRGKFWSLIWTAK